MSLCTGSMPREIPQFIQEEGWKNMRQRCIIALFDKEQVSDGKGEAAQRILKFDSVERCGKR